MKVKPPQPPAEPAPANPKVMLSLITLAGELAELKYIYEKLTVHPYRATDYRRDRLRLFEHCARRVEKIFKPTKTK